MSDGPQTILAVVLAGGLARRMGGGDKCLKPLGGRPILAHVIERLAGQAGQILINANGDVRRFDAFGLPVAADVVGGFGGPLVGVLTALEWAKANAPWVTDVLSVPGDGPFLPRDLAQRLATARAAEGAELATAGSGGRANPVVGLWPVSLAGALRQAVVEEKIAKVDVWTERYPMATVLFDDAPVDPFFNANTPEDLIEAERLLALT
ncbi:MAG: molybdenum cofactor guanylyltransferase MobA [Alphaproteobacteria bacterium]|nr:molybdenum cofactor guanylyltransferase MobA [Alphaproteobacteria bacterium]